MQCALGCRVLRLLALRLLAQYDELVSTGRARSLSPSDLRLRIILKGKGPAERKASLEEKRKPSFLHRKAPSQFTVSIKRKISFRAASQASSPPRQRPPSPPAADGDSPDNAARTDQVSEAPLSVVQADRLVSPPCHEHLLRARVPLTALWRYLLRELSCRLMPIFELPTPTRRNGRHDKRCERR